MAATLVARTRAAAETRRVGEALGASPWVSASAESRAEPIARDSRRPRTKAPPAPSPTEMSPMPSRARPVVRTGRTMAPWGTTTHSPQPDRIERCSATYVGVPSSEVLS